MIEFRKCLDDIQAYVPGRPIEDVQKEFDLSEVTKLASNENPFEIPESVKKAVVDSFFASGQYPDGSCLKLRGKLAKKFNINENQLIFGNGTEQLLDLFAKTIINPADECITGEITFPLYDTAIISMDGIMVYSPMKDYGFDLDDILNRITDKTRAIYIANPNNPTGTAFSRKEQIEFLKKVPSNVFVVMDEAYAEFVSDDIDFPDTLEMLNLYKNLILFKTFSKAYGLASFRVGYGIAHEDIINNMDKMRNAFNVSTYAQAAAYEIIDNEVFLNKTIDNNKKALNYVYKELDEMGLTYIKSYTNFIMIDVKKDCMKVFNDLMKAGYIIRPGKAYGMDNFIRVSIGTLDDQMKGFIQALKNVLDI